MNEFLLYQRFLSNNMYDLAYEPSIDTSPKPSPKASKRSFYSNKVVSNNETIAYSKLNGNSVQVGLNKLNLLSRGKFYESS